MHDFHTALYTPTDLFERERVFRLVVAVGKLARNSQNAPKIRFTPEQVRYAIQRFPSDRAAGLTVSRATFGKPLPSIITFGLQSS